MSYERINWRDHVVERPRTYLEAQNPDGTKTYTAAPGQIIQQGTPQSATNFNMMDEAIQHMHIAFDELFCMSQAEMRAAQAEIKELRTELEALK